MMTVGKNRANSRGRKGRHAVEFPLKTVVYEALYYFKKKDNLTGKDIADALREFGRGINVIPNVELYKEVEYHHFDVRTDRINRVFDSKKIDSDELAKVLDLYFFHKYGKVYESIKAGVIMEAKEAFVREARKLLGYDGLLHVDVIKKLHGRYALYRPYPLKPKDAISIGVFNIGSVESDFDCEFQTFYEDKIRRPPHTAKGKIILHGSDNKRFSAITVGDGPSHFMFYFDHLEIAEQLYEMGGVMIASYGAFPSSAWPMFAIRDDDRHIQPGVINKSDYHNLPEMVRNQLDRGAVYWDAKDFPKPYDQKP